MVVIGVGVLSISVVGERGGGRGKGERGNDGWRRVEEGIKFCMFIQFKLANQASISNL